MMGTLSPLSKREIPLYLRAGIVIILGLLNVSLKAEAAQIQPASAAPRQHVSVSEDPGSWRRNPFIASVNKGAVTPAAKGIHPKAGSVVPAKQEQNFRLQGIMQVDKAYHALINGRTVKAGNTIDGYTIKRISRYQVVALNERKETIIYDIYQGRIDRGKK